MGQRISRNGTYGTNRGTLSWEVLSIEISTFLQRIYPCCTGVNNQGVFVTKCFAAAGCSYFVGSSTDYQRKLFNGSKPLTKNIKRTFPIPFMNQELATFFENRITVEKVRDLMTAFAIPLSVEANKEILSKVLSEQFSLFITSGNDNVADIVALEYQKYLAEPSFESKQRLAPLYPDDSAYVLDFLPQRSYSVSIYEKFQHTWVIRNTGKQTWRGRKLVFANHTEVRPRADKNFIDIPDTLPGKDVKITTDFDTRGFEGSSDCIWEMQDSDGSNCFPNNKRLFCVTINANFKCERIVQDNGGL